MTNTITVHARDSHVYDGVADGAVSPGELVSRTGQDGDIPTYGPHAAAGEFAEPYFAKEYSHTGMSIDDDYQDGDHMELRKGLTGDRYLAYLADGENVSTDDYLVSAGDGSLQAAAADGSDESGIVAKPAEDLENASGSPIRIEVEVV